MGKRLRILLVEDREEDADLLLRALRREGYDVIYEIVDTQDAMRAALERQAWDVITSDHAMPQFSAPAALALAKELRPGLPFIIVSGEIDLNLAVSLMRQGAHDYIQKRELPRLMPAIERELHEAAMRRDYETERKRAEEDLRTHQIELEMQNEELRRTQAELEASRARYFDLYDLAPMGYVTLGETGLIMEANLTIANLLGVSRGALVKQPLTRYILPADQDIYYRHRKKLFETGVLQTCEIRVTRADAEPCWVRVVAISTKDADGLSTSRMVMINITEQKQAEDELKSANVKLESLWHVSSLVEAGTKVVSDHILESITQMTQSDYGFYGYLNDDESVMTIHSWSGEAMKDCSMIDKPQHFPVSEAGVWAEAIRRREPLILNTYGAEHTGKKGLPDGHVRLTNLMVVPHFTKGRITSVAAVANRQSGYDQSDVNQIAAFLGSVQAIVDSKRTEEAVRTSQQRWIDIIKSLPDATLVIDKEGKVVAWNKAIEEMTGIEAEEMLGKGDHEYAIPFCGERRPILIDLALKNDRDWERQYPSIQRMGDVLFEESYAPKLFPGNIHLSATASVVRDVNGEIVGAIECIRNVTARPTHLG